jgi:hypothetical protein
VLVNVPLDAKRLISCAYLGVSGEKTGLYLDGVGETNFRANYHTHKKNSRVKFGNPMAGAGRR